MVTESCMLSVVMDTAGVSLRSASKSPGSVDISEYISDIVDGGFIDGISDMFSDGLHGINFMVTMIKVKTKFSCLQFSEFHLSPLLKPRIFTLFLYLG